MINLFSLRLFVVISALFWLGLQVLYVYNNKYDALVSDPGTYVLLAWSCVTDGTLYPNYSHLYDSYIFNPGWVNFIILWIKMFGTTSNLAYIQVIFNAITLFLIYRICRKLFEKEVVAIFALYSYMLLPAVFTISSHLFSEPYYIVLSLSSLYFCLLGKRFSYLSGFFLALAMWTRPIALGWLVACLFWYLKSKDWKSATRHVAMYIFTCMIIAISTHQNYPNYLYKSTTGGVNLIMGANDDASGGYCAAVFQEGKIGHIPDEFKSKLTVNEKDSIWTHRAVHWIKTHPIQYSILTCKKMYYLFNSSPSFLYNYRTAPKTKKNELIYSQSFRSPANLCFSPYSELFMSFLSSVYFKIIMISVVFGLLIYSWKNMNLFFIYIPILLCTLLTVLTVGEPRYNIVMLPFLSIVFSYCLIQIAQIIKTYFK